MVRKGEERGEVASDLESVTSLCAHGECAVTAVTFSFFASLLLPSTSGSSLYVLSYGASSSSEPLEPEKVTVGARHEYVYGAVIISLHG